MHFQIEHRNMNYPLGIHIDNTYESINYIIDHFLKVAKSDIENNAQIAIVCRGSSGAIMAAILYTKLKALTTSMPRIDMNIKICHIKKSGENAHNTSVNVFREGDNAMYIWIDDFTDSGNTFNECLKAMRNHFAKDTFQFDWSVCASGRTRIFEGNTVNSVLHKFN